MMARRAAGSGRMQAFLRFRPFAEIDFAKERLQRLKLHPPPTGEFSGLGEYLLTKSVIGRYSLEALLQ